MKKIAYLLLVHNDPEQLKRLVHKLNYHADFYIHIDKKVDQKVYKKILNGMNNVFFVENRFPVYWAGFNMIEATKSLIRETEDNRHLYKRCILLSGNDYPITSNEKIHEFFEINSNIEFIRGFNVTQSNSKQYLNHIKRYHLRDSFKNINIISKLIQKLVSFFPAKPSYILLRNGLVFDVFFGSQWWALTPKCIKEIIEIADKYPEIDNYFRYSFSPDEKYFHSLFFNSSFKNNNIDKGVGNYKGIGTYKWSNIHLIHPSLSKWYKYKDREEVLESEKLFLRKVNSSESNELLDFLDKIK